MAVSRSIDRRRRCTGLVTYASAMLIALVAAPVAGATPAQTLSLSTQPTLFPAFSTQVPDYVVRCTGAPVHVTVTTPPNAKASVDGGLARKGTFSTDVAVTSGQGFRIDLNGPSGRDGSYFVRCLPPDLPAFTAQRSGTPQAEWYVVAPSLGSIPSGEARSYVAIFDTNGVPVWWIKADSSAVIDDAKFLPNGDVGWLHSDGGTPQSGEERTLDGQLVRTFNTAGGPLDLHDFQVLPNGDYLLIRTFDLPGQDLTSCGGSTNQTVLDNQIQEISPSGELVWSWTASDHIPYSEVSPAWRSTCTASGGVHDVYHMNSIEPVGSSSIVTSLRHLDAVYKLARPSGAVIWKLGGLMRAESLTVVGDPVGDPLVFGGQHDARVLSDGTVTVQDNGTNRGRGPRGVHYEINEAAHTARFVEQVTDPDAPSSFCCGSARKLPGGDWVTSWGANNFVGELTSSGARVFKLTFTRGLFSYRAQPLLPGQLSRSALRLGMDAQHPR